MILYLQSEVMSSGNPSYLTGLLPGGANTQTAGTTGAPFRLPFIDPIVREVIDDTATTPAPTGTLLVLEYNAKNNPGAQYWLTCSTANQALGEMHYGVIFKPASIQGGQALVVVNGPVLALVQSQSNTNKAIALGDPLCSDNAGNLTSAPATPAAGTVLAQALAAIAGGTAAAISPVIMGGY